MKKLSSPVFIVAITAVVFALISFFFLEQWLTALQALRAIIALPFLFIFPGLFMVQIFFTQLDLSEKIILTFFLSFVVIYLNILALEKIAEQLTSQNTAVTIAAVNLVSIIFFLAYREWRITRK